MSAIVLSALVERRALLAGGLHKAQAAIHQMHADLASLDAVIKQIDPDYHVGAIRPKYRRQPSPAEFGVMSRAVLDTLRRSAEPLSAQGIAAKIIAERGLNAKDRGLVRNMNKRVDTALRYQRTNGMVEDVATEEAGVWWVLAR